MSKAGRGHWPLLGAAAMMLMLAACSTPQTRPPLSPASVPESPPSLPAQIPVPPAPSMQSVIPAEVSPWDRLRSRFAIIDCDYNNNVLRQAQRYTRVPSQFEANWRKAMPFLMLVIDAIERRDLPGEFALLPYVESLYRPLPAKGRGPSGMWQLMARTAVDQGLQIRSEYDGRLDAIESTNVALGLIERYDREFGDWRLANMAFNAGEYRIKRALGPNLASTLSTSELNRIKLSSTTHEHLARLLALACIIGEPQRFKVTLPMPTASDMLQVIPLGAPIDLRLAARLADMSIADLHRFNPAWRHDRMVDGAPWRLLLPRQSARRFSAALPSIPENQRANWRDFTNDQAISLAALAMNSGMSADLIASANGLDVGAHLQVGQKLLMPGTGSASRQATGTDTHVIRAGDTLSKIAHQYRVRVAELLRWNDLKANSILKLGARLLICAP